MKNPLNPGWTIRFLLLGAAGFLIYFLVYPRTAVEFAYRPDISKSRARVISDSLLRQLRYDLSSFSTVAYLAYDERESIARQRREMSAPENGRVSPSSDYTWFVKYRAKVRTVIRMNANAERDGGLQEPWINVSLSLDGSLHSLDAHIPDSVRLGSLSEEEASFRAARFILAHHTGEIDSLVESSRQEKPARTEFTFTWTGKGSDGTSVRVSVGMAGSFITAYRADPAPDDQARTIIDSFQILAVTSVVIGIIFALLIFWTMVRRLRNDELGFRSAVFWAALSTVILAFCYAIRYSEEDFAYTSWIFYLLIGISSLFRGLMMLFAWSAGEGVGRVHWNEKYLTLDAVQRFAFRSRWVGVGLLQGVGQGGILLGILALLQSITTLVPGAVQFLGTMTSDSSSQAGFLESPLKNVASVLDLAITTATAYLVLTVFAGGLVRGVTRRNLAVIAAGGLFWMLMSQTVFHAFYPLSIHLVFAFVLGAAVTSLFLLTDMLSTAVGILTMILAHHGLFALHNPPEGFPVIGAVYFGIILLIAAGGGALSAIKRSEIDLADYTPQFVKRLSERHRLQMEVESARHIQQSLLPREIPHVARLDIAAACIPAFEVGGDYYDFIPFDDRAMGILIGDVSGKGISAAFYMTLAKGVIASQARRVSSPKQVLESVNALLYEIMERGKFISMVYGVFNTREETLTYAHAGHNPIFHYCAADGSVSILRSRGMALGLEMGTKFGETLAQETIPLRAGDVFLFYTDGYVEAMNRHFSEFGESQLRTAFSNCAREPARSILHGLTARVNAHMGRTKQHDDMTMVAVRILPPDDSTVV